MGTNKNWWMTPEQLQNYSELTEALGELQREHRGLIAKAVDKTITRGEAERLREVNAAFNKAFAARKALEDQNPILPENILRLT